MSIGEPGSPGELVSSIVVLITLIYLAVQVRHSKNIAMGHSYQYSRGLIGEGKCYKPLNVSKWRMVFGYI